MIERLLKGVEEVIARVPHCWLITVSQSGSVSARPMGRVARGPTESDWTLSFLADSRSKKIRELRAAPGVQLIFERAEEGFVTLAGSAAVIADSATLEQRWQHSYDRIFPTAAEKANAVFIDIRAQEMRLWIRGLTPEPFGQQSLTLHRPLGGDWRIEPGDVASPAQAAKSDSRA